MTPCDLEKIKERLNAKPERMDFMDWVSAVVEDDKALIAEVEALRKKVETLTQFTVADFQDRVRALVIVRSKAPDSAIDGAGCDSGDWEDFTLTEISQGFNFVDERIEALRAKLERVRHHIFVSLAHSNPKLQFEALEKAFTELETP